MLRTSLAPGEVVDRLERRARKGKLPGFRREGERSCSVLVFAGAYDHRLTLRAETDGTVRSDLRMLRKLPVIVAGVLVLATWPGLPLTDSMLRIYFDWYDNAPIRTWWWYLPMMLLAIPVVLKQLAKARGEARAEAKKTLIEVAPAIEAEITP